MKCLAVSGDVSFNAQLFTSVTGLHVSSEWRPAVNSASCDISSLWTAPVLSRKSGKEKRVASRVSSHSVTHFEWRGTHCPWWHHRVLISRLCLSTLLCKETGRFSLPVVDQVGAHYYSTALTKLMVLNMGPLNDQYVQTADRENHIMCPMWSRIHTPPLLSPDSCLASRFKDFPYFSSMNAHNKTVSVSLWNWPWLHLHCLGKAELRRTRPLMSLPARFCY